MLRYFSGFDAFLIEILRIFKILGLQKILINCFSKASVKVNPKIQKARRTKKPRTESETSLCSIGSEDSSCSTNSTGERSFPVCIPRKCVKESSKGKHFFNIKCSKFLLYQLTIVNVTWLCIILFNYRKIQKFIRISDSNHIST